MRVTPRRGQLDSKVQDEAADMTWEVAPVCASIIPKMLVSGCLLGKLREGTAQGF